MDWNGTQQTIFLDILPAMTRPTGLAKLGFSLSLFLKYAPKLPSSKFVLTVFILLAMKFC